jgi:hypothetical protein
MDSVLLLEHEDDGLFRLLLQFSALLFVDGAIMARLIVARSLYPAELIRALLCTSQCFYMTEWL